MSGLPLLRQVGPTMPVDDITPVQPVWPSAGGVLSRQSASAALAGDVARVRPVGHVESGPMSGLPLLRQTVAPSVASVAEERADGPPLLRQAAPGAAAERAEGFRPAAGGDTSALELLRPARPPIQRDVQDAQIASPSEQPAVTEPPDPLAGLSPQQIDRLARLVYARLRQRMVVDAERLGR
jgi:hypothetical protein